MVGKALFLEFLVASITVFSIANYLFELYFIGLSLLQGIIDFPGSSCKFINEITLIELFWGVVTSVNRTVKYQP